MKRAKMLYMSEHNRDCLYVVTYKKNLRFVVNCDGTGFSFTIEKAKLKEMIR